MIVSSKVRMRRMSRGAIFLCIIVGMLTAGQPIELFVRAQGRLGPAIQQRRQNRIKKQLDRATKNNVAEAEKSGPENPGPGQATRPAFNARPTSHSLDGIQEKGIGDFFSPEERNLVIPGFGRAPSYLIILRQLDLTPEQKSAIQMIRRKVGNQLATLRTQQIRMEQQLEEAIYGDSFNPEEVNRLSREVGQRQGQTTVIQANIEAQFREILTADQFFVFRFLVGEMLLPQRRLTPNQLRQQLPRRGAQPPRDDF